MWNQDPDKVLDQVRYQGRYQGHMHDKDEDLKDLETIYDSLRRKIYEMSE